MDLLIDSLYTSKISDRIVSVLSYIPSGRDLYSLRIDNNRSRDPIAVSVARFMPDRQDSSKCFEYCSAA